MMKLREMCSDEVPGFGIVSSDNIVEWQKVANHMAIENIKSHCEQIIADDFLMISNKTAFLDLPYKDVKPCISFFNKAILLIVSTKIWNVSLIFVTSLLKRGWKWPISTSYQWKDKAHLLCFDCACRITFNVTCNVTALMFFAHTKFQHCEHSNDFVILTEEDNNVVDYWGAVIKWHSE